MGLTFDTVKYISTTIPRHAMKPKVSLVLQVIGHWNMICLIVELWQYDPYLRGF